MDYHDGDVENADDGEEGGVPEGGDLLLEGDGQDDEQRDHDEDEFAAEEEVEVGSHPHLQQLGQAEVQLVSDNDGVAHTGAEAVQQLHFTGKLGKAPGRCRRRSPFPSHTYRAQCPNRWFVAYIFAQDRAFRW